MKLSNKRLQTLIHGAYRFLDQKGGYMSFCHYDEEQTKYLEFEKFFYDRAFFTSSVTIELITDATEIAFDYKVYLASSFDTVDLFIEGVAHEMKAVKDMGEKGTLSFTLPEGKKKVVIYLPLDTNLGVKNFRVNGSWRSVPKRKTNVLWIGDSITQGYGGMISSHTYVNVANRILGYEILNQGIGGYYYDAKVLKTLENFKPDKIILAMGTNQFRSADKKEVIDAYYEKLNALYPNVPMLAVTPLWRELSKEDKPIFESCVQIIRSQAEKYPNLTIVDGFTLVPGCPQYFLDGLHPNALGMTLYGQNLANIIKKIGW
ncbi:MAG: SGNH/GDSL hydrolase family protein [Clostridia bacterium]|nr:SGNH/GDSL hydrolase family protein [Clostridia bacterium]